MMDYYNNDWIIQNFDNILVKRKAGWIYFEADNICILDRNKCGKWMFFFNDFQFAFETCKEAVEKGIVVEAKHRDSPDGVCCFYINGDDLAAHKKVIQFFLDHNLIRRTKTGKLYNISFKFDTQTRNGEYGDDFHAEIKLSQFIDLETEEWKI